MKKMIFIAVVATLLFVLIMVLAGCSSVPVVENLADGDEDIIEDNEKEETQEGKEEKEEEEELVDGPIDTFYGVYMHDDDGKLTLFDNYIIVGGIWRNQNFKLINTKFEALEYFEEAKLSGAKHVWYWLDSSGNGHSEGPTYDIDEVMEGYRNGTWTFANAEQDYLEQK